MLRYALHGWVYIGSFISSGLFELFSRWFDRRNAPPPTRQTFVE